MLTVVFRIETADVIVSPVGVIGGVIECRWGEGTNGGPSECGWTVVCGIDGDGGCDCGGNNGVDVEVWSGVIDG